VHFPCYQHDYPLIVPEGGDASELGRSQYAQSAIPHYRPFGHRFRTLLPDLARLVLQIPTFTLTARALSSQVLSSDTSATLPEGDQFYQPPSDS